MTTPSSGSTPFGFAFTPRSQLVVSEAAGDAPNGAASSYRFGPDGALELVSGSVSTHHGAAPIDLGLSRGGRFLYVLEAGTGTIGAFAVGQDGHLEMLPDTPGLTAASGLQGLAAY